jgi:hypothetical protein
MYFGESRNRLLMKGTIFLTVFLAVFILACGTTNKQRTSKAMWKDIYIRQFKLTYFRAVLLKSYNKSAAVREIIELDHSGFTESILTERDSQLIDSLATADNETLKADSTQGDQRAEGAQGKRPLGYILERLDSKWLDRLAIKRFTTSGFKASLRDN